MTENTTPKLNITHLDPAEPHALFCQFSCQSDPQDAYIELDLRDGSMYADYNSEIGSAVPMSVYYGSIHRYTIPPLMADAANRLMDKIAPLAQRVLDGVSWEYDGSRTDARLSDDSQDAADEIERLTEYAEFDPDDTCWEAGIDWYADAARGVLTADTTDEQIDEWMDDDPTPSDCPNAVIDRYSVIEWMRKERDELAWERDHEEA